MEKAELAMSKLEIADESPTEIIVDYLQKHSTTFQGLQEARKKVRQSMLIVSQEC